MSLEWGRRDSNPDQRIKSPMLYQLSYVPSPPRSDAILGKTPHGSPAFRQISQRHQQLRVLARPAGLHTPSRRPASAARPDRGSDAPDPPPAIASSTSPAPCFPKTPTISVKSPTLGPMGRLAQSRRLCRVRAELIPERPAHHHRPPPVRVAQLPDRVEQELRRPPAARPSTAAHCRAPTPRCRTAWR